MPTPRLAWPATAESERQETQESAAEAARLLEDSNRLLRTALEHTALNGAAAQIATAMALQSQALALQERIQRLMVQAHARKRTIT